MSAVAAEQYPMPSAQPTHPFTRAIPESRAAQAPSAAPRIHLVPALPEADRLSAPPLVAPSTGRAELERRRAALDTPLALPIERAIPASDPGAIGSAIVLAAVEALHGARPVAQLARWLTPELLAPLSRRAAITIAAKGRHTARATLRRVRVCRLGDFVAELSIVVEDADRVRAVALRLEARRGQWRAVALEIG